MYGSLFADRWKNVSPDEMRDHWIEQLGSFNALTIAAALRALDSFALPPSLPEFKSLCKSFHVRPEQPRLAHAHASQHEADEAMERIRRMVGHEPTGQPDYRQWARDIVALEEQGKYNAPFSCYEIACVALEIQPIPRSSRRSAKERQYND